MAGAGTDKGVFDASGDGAAAEGGAQDTRWPRRSGQRCLRAAPTPSGIATAATYLRGLRRDALDLPRLRAQRTPCLFQVVVGLQAEPETLAGAERGGTPDRAVGADAALAKHDFVDAARRHAGGTRQCVLADAQRDQEFLQQDFAGVDVGQGLHDGSMGQW